MIGIVRGEIPPDVSLPLPGILRDFRSVAPDAYLRYNKVLRCWEVMKDLIWVVTEHDVEIKRTIPVVRAAFDELNQRAIDNLRYRRWVGQRYMGNPEAYLRWLKQEELDAKAKEREIARDMMAEGFMKAYRMDKSHTVNLGGHTWPTQSQANVSGSSTPPPK